MTGLAGPPALVTNDPFVWSDRAVQENFDEPAVSGLASMYPASDWSIAPGHHGYQRACELISGQASAGQMGHQGSQAPGRPNLHLLSILSQTSAGKLAQPLHATDQAVASLLVSKL